MARPRIFISSTFFDLRQVRADLERFISDIGYEPVQHERGQVPYGSIEKLEQYCYKEINQVDILVNIIGGRFGSVSHEEQNSISQMELKTALKQNKQCYVFVDSAVYAEYRMYLRNKEVKGINYVAADDERIFKFIEEIEALPRNNQLIEFRHSDEIANHLREQWAGLFQRFLQEQAQLPDRRTADDLHEALKTVKQLTTFLTNERRQQGSVINEILLSNHPIFARLRQLTRTPYPVFFRNKTEMTAWLNARTWNEIDEEWWDDPEFSEWYSTDQNITQKFHLKIQNIVFDDDKLKVFTAEEWNDDWVILEAIEEAEPSTVATDDDLPF